MNNKSKLDEIVNLQKLDYKVEQCEDCNHLMVNVDEDEVRKGDLVTLKRKGIRLSNPNTEDVLCINCELDDKKESFLGKVANWFDDDDDDDDTPLFSGGGFSFGGFGGGGFSGGGASRGF